MQKKDEFLIKHQKGFMIQNRDAMSDRPEQAGISDDCKEFLKKNGNGVAGGIADSVIRDSSSGICARPAEKKE